MPGKHQAWPTPQGAFSHVLTNPAAFEGGALRVRPYHAEPPACHRLCPINLCKGQVRSPGVLGWRWPLRAQQEKPQTWRALAARQRLPGQAH